MGAWQVRIRCLLLPGSHHALLPPTPLAMNNGLDVLISSYSYCRTRPDQRQCYSAAFHVPPAWR